MWICPSRRWFLVTLPLWWAVAGCGPRYWNGAVSHVGPMRVVLAEGQTEGRVDLAPFAGIRGTYAVGALAGLEGEITVLSGEVWLSRVAEDGTIETRRVGAPAGRATLLTSTLVGAWTSMPIDRDVPADAVEAFIHASAARAGLDTTRPFPFLIEGPVAHLEGHVIHGACPHAAVEGAAPALFERATVPSARIIGFYAENSGGVMTHHGQNTHMHGLLSAEPPTAVHIDRVELVADAVLRLPASARP